MINYGIKKTYISRSEYNHFDDMPFKSEWQKEVYLLSKDIAEKEGYIKIADIGCGSGFKLINFLGDFDTVGYEIEPTLSKLKSKYPDHEWELSDFNSEPTRADVVICSDVIEHVLNPDHLCEYLKKFSAKKYVISTPHKKLMYGYDHMGPPLNPTHVREWDYEEFRTYMGTHFNIEKHFVINRRQSTQVVVAVLK